MDKKLLILFSISAVAIIGGLGFMYPAQDMAIRHVGAQYTPWDTDRMVEHSDMIFSGTIVEITPIVETEIEYYDGIYQIFDQKKVPYQYVTIQVSDWFKGNGGAIITVKDVANAVVFDGKTLISVEHENVPTYEIGQTGTYFVEIIGDELRLDGFYSFLKEDDTGKKSSDFIEKTGKTPQLILTSKTK